MSEEKFTCTYCGMELPSADTFHDLQSCAEYMTTRIAQLEAENATLREQLRWRNTIDEQPSYFQEVLVRPRIAKQCISTFIYFGQLAETFKRDYVEWLPIPEVTE